MTDDLDRLAEQAAANPEDAWGWLRLAQAFLGGPTAVAALHVLDRAIEQAKDDPQLHAELAVALEQLEDWDRALLAWRRALVLGLGVEVRLASLLLRRGAPAEALEAARQGLAGAPTVPALLELQARAYWALRAPADGVRPAELAVTHSQPEHVAERRRLLAQLYQAVGRRPERLQLLRQQQAEQRANLADRLDLGEALLEAELRVEAAQIASTLSTEGPLPLPVELRLADLAVRAGVPALVLPRLEALVDQDGGPTALSAYGIALVEAGRPLDAVALLRRSLELSPEQARARHALGRALVRLGAHREATSHLVKAAAMEPEDDRVRADLAEALQPNALNRQNGLVGDLRLFSVPDLLQLLSQLRATGRLEIKVPRGSAAVVLVGGRILDAFDDRIEPLLTALLVLGPEVTTLLERVPPHQRGQERTLVAALGAGSNGLLRGLGELLRERALRSLAPILDLREGQATFTPDPAEVPIDDSLLVTVEYAVLEASRRNDEARQ